MVSKIYVWINILQSAEPCPSFLNGLKGQSQEIVKDPIGLRGQSEDILQYKEPNIVGWDSVRILDKRKQDFFCIHYDNVIVTRVAVKQHFKNFAKH